ncbi:MAG TPA: TetR/AcrR family transcriptional regulator [Pseudomonadales bacterium]|jgi:AcrR family transcriptional regulator|nr:TetR/AcrR family transcriptional regulator [Pseudomonadales bacterium]
MAARKNAPVRRRNAANTREAILASARTAFTNSGYDGAGVREIASGAGVTAMLVNRYFGSKEQLFAEVVARTMAVPVILTPDILESGNPGEAIAEALVDLTRTDASPLDGFLIMHRSGSSRRAAEIGREQIETHHHKTMTAALTGTLAPQRAAVVLAIVAGIQIMRQMIGLTALSKAKRKDLVQILAPLFQQLVDGASSRKRV